MPVGTAYKFGELPVFGPRIPSKLVSIAGSDREILLQGRRSEAQALGIGAFSYYRRVVEDRKSHLLDRIINVVEKISPNDPIIQELKDAKKEKQFSKAIDNIKSTFPQGLLINGENPLKLLHAALSQGIHNLSDDECLHLATSVRVILSELISRMDDLMKDENEVVSAINNLKNVGKK